MTPTKVCPNCETTLEFEIDGKRLAFTAHDAEFCRLAAGDLARTLRRVLVQQAETFKHAAESHRRAFEERVFELAANISPDADLESEIAELVGDDGHERFIAWKRHRDEYYGRKLQRFAEREDGV